MLRYTMLIVFSLTFSNSGQSQPLNYNNCTQSIVLDSLPQRILPVDINSVEIALALGLSDQMVGTAAVSDTELILSEYREAFLSLPQLYPVYPSLSVIQKSRADFMIAGWNAGFFKKSPITPEALAAQGIASYILRETCNIAPTQDSPPFASTLIDIETIARIGGKEEAGLILSQALRTRLKRIQADVAAHGRPKAPSVFVYDSGANEAVTAGGPAAMSEVIRAAGARNIAKNLPSNWGTISWQEVAEAAPELIIIVDYGFGDGNRKRRALLARPELQSVPAIRSKNLFIAPYSAALSGIRSIGLAELLANHLICSFSPHLNQGDFTCLNQPYSPLD